jgi:hypothetical protein
MLRRCVLIVVVALVVGSGVGLAQSRECGRVGTWFGQGDAGFTWMAIDTPGVSATAGQFHLEWVRFDPTLGGFFPMVVRVTKPQGVWEKVNASKYKFPWVAYAFDANAAMAFVVRTSGLATMAGCDQVNMTYTLELFAPGQDIWRDTPLFAFPGTAVEKRMPVVVVQ